jgi:ABC-type sugar transport system ATPase subunit
MDDVKENKANDVDDTVIDVDLPEDTSDEVAVETAAEETESPENEQEKVVNSAKDRIAKLTKKMRQMERREQEALRYAEQVQTEANNLKQRMQTMDSNYIQEYGTRLEVETAQAEAALKRAVDIGDSDQVVEAQKQLTKLYSQSERYGQAKVAHEQEKLRQQVANQQPQYASPPPQEQSIRRPDPKAEEWAQRNEWFGQDEAMTFAAFGIHKKLVEDEGFDPTTDEYYTELDNRIASRFQPEQKAAANDSGTSKRAAQTVAGVSRATGSSSSGRRRVKLTPTQVAIAKKLGVPLEEYAKYVKE